MFEGAKTTARELRAKARANVSRVLTKLLADHDVRQADLAHATGVGTAIVQRWGDREAREVPTVADTPQMPREIAMGLLRWQAEHLRALVVDAPESGEREFDGVAHVGQLTKEHAEAVDRILHAVRTDGGTITPAQARDARRELMDLVHVAYRGAEAMRAIAERGP